MVRDREIEFFKLVAEAFEGLDEGARRRVTRWFFDRFGSYAGSTDPGESLLPVRDDTAQVGTSHVAHTLVDLEALYAAAKTTALWERVLITGYWLQELKRQEDFDAMTVNQAMRQCGYGTNNITRELTKLTSGELITVQPPTPSSKGRRRFRVSREGLRWSKRRLGQLET